MREGRKRRSAWKIGRCIIQRLVKPVEALQNVRLRYIAYKAGQRTNRYVARIALPGLYYKSLKKRKYTGRLIKIKCRTFPFNFPARYSMRPRQGAAYRFRYTWTLVLLLSESYFPSFPDIKTTSHPYRTESRCRHSGSTGRGGMYRIVRMWQKNSKPAHAEARVEKTQE